MSTYNSSSAATDDQFRLSFYIVEDEPIKDGDQVVIYALAYKKALSSEKTGNYNVGTDIEIAEDGTVTGYTESNIWTVVENGNDTYSFAQGDQNIGINDGYASMGMGVTDDDWEVIALEEEGLYNVRNTARGNYMEWYVQYNNWSTYNSSSATTDDQFQLSFYIVEDEPTTEDPDQPAVEGLGVEADPKSGTSVEAGQVITLNSAEGTDIYYTMSTDGSQPVDPQVTDEQKYTGPSDHRGNSGKG